MWDNAYKSDNLDYRAKLVQLLEGNLQSVLINDYIPSKLNWPSTSILTTRSLMAKVLFVSKGVLVSYDLFIIAYMNYNCSLRESLWRIALHSCVWIQQQRKTIRVLFQIKMLISIQLSSRAMTLKKLQDCYQFVLSSITADLYRSIRLQIWVLCNLAWVVVFWWLNYKGVPFRKHRTEISAPYQGAYSTLRSRHLSCYI